MFHCLLEMSRITNVFTSTKIQIFKAMNMYLRLLKLLAWENTY